MGRPDLYRPQPGGAIAHGARPPVRAPPPCHPQPCRYAAIFPHLAEALSQGSHQRNQDSFETGLEILLDGIAQRYASSPRGDPQPPPAPHRH
ncbi:MAG: hypothetical protein DLM64_14370 [Solirubrobacterales bacterium]|nr:MAG: hypothetical protein DLM64_14370 [Solirubrobacterales bacterium]